MNTEPEERTDEEAAWIFQDRMDQEGKEELHREEQAREEAQDVYNTMPKAKL